MSLSLITDAYIDEIIKANEAYNPNINKTQGIKLRELIKLMRDHIEQESSSLDLFMFPDEDDYPDYIPVILTFVNNSDNFVVINDRIGLSKNDSTAIELNPFVSFSFVTYGENLVSISPLIQALESNTVFQFNFTGEEITQTITIQNL